ncbi:hypothetical protein EMPS_06367 [Entomortierella parvispora]|uniref:Galactose oxidase n=1 Tax=Entomortierella parvispora TaxID=205924 RepID=A0A9P3HC55_9FUNG|nr:hypothetical protein EMPS_06367 [Entomortierella parvispora]
MSGPRSVQRSFTATTVATTPSTTFSASCSSYTSASRSRSWKHIRLSAAATIAAMVFGQRTDAAPSPYPVGGFAICQTSSSLHIQGGVAFAPSATYLQPTNQHFRLDLSVSFDGAITFPNWANLTSDWSPYQRFHSGACTPDQATFLTVGNADEALTGATGGFMTAYSIATGKWEAVSKAVSLATGGGGGSGGKGNGSSNGAAGRTMAAILLSPSTTNTEGVVLGGGWIPQGSNAVRSALATDLTNLVTEADLIGLSGGDIGSLAWSQAPLTGNGGNNLNSNIGPIGGTRLVNLPNGKALVLGGVTKGNGGGVSFSSLPILDMGSGAVNIQKTQGSGIPTPRYGHCVALSTDGSTVYMFGGSLVSNDKVTNDLFALNVQTWTWSQPTIRSNPAATPPPVRDHQCIMVGDQVLSFFGFNSNQVPASSGSLTAPGSSVPSVPPAPVIYVLSTSQGTWSTKFNALPNTPAPPPIPDAPTDGGKGKVSSAGIAFGVIFGGAILGVIGFLVYSHRRKKQRKADTLLLIELQERQLEEEKWERERERMLEREREDKYLPPTPIEQAHYAGHHHNQYQPDGMDGQLYSPPTESPYYQAGNPFQNQDYLNQQQLYHQQPYQAAYPPPPPPNQQRNPFEASAYYTQPGRQQPDSADYIPEEMGHFSPNVSTSPKGDEQNTKVPLHMEHGPGGSNESASSPSNSASGAGGGISGRAGDKTSFIDPGPTYR